MRNKERKTKKIARAVHEKKKRQAIAVIGWKHMNSKGTQKRAGGNKEDKIFGYRRVSSSN